MHHRAIITAVILALPMCLWPPSVRGVDFNRAFAPQEGLVCEYEKPERQEICLNGSWQFQGSQDASAPSGTAPVLGSWDTTAIKIPSPWNVNGFFAGQAGGNFRAYPSYPTAWEKLPAAWMRKSVNVPASWKGQRILLLFGAVAGELVVYVNGQRAGDGFDIFFPQEFDVSELLHFGTDNEILVKVISPKAYDKPGQYGRREYLSGSFWGTFIAGIWQDVFLVEEPKVGIASVFVQPSVDRNLLCAQVTVANHSSMPASAMVSGAVLEWLNQAGSSVLEAPEVKWKLADDPSLVLPEQPMNLAPGETQTIMLTASVDGRLKLWSPGSPNLYGLLLTLSVDGKPVDIKYQRFGWRQFTLAGNKLLLNSQPIVLRGDSWHFLGIPQMTRRYACGWYRLLKDAGANAVRLHASVYPSFYHDLADEMGIMILDESAIWASDGGPKADSDLFWTNCRTHVGDNGNRAYESDLGRMEGLAYECCGLLNRQQKFGADYQSVFNIVWYSVQPLPLGKEDLARPVDLRDGIFFGKYREGVPGIQPERLGPYTTTLNPGYDPSLPLYRPWPMFDAIRDVNMGKTNSAWAQRPDLSASVISTTATSAKAMASFVPGNGDGLVKNFAKAGIPFAPYAADTNTDILLVDGALAQNADASAGLKAVMDNTLAHGGTVWVWNIRPESASFLSEWLGGEIAWRPAPRLLLSSNSTTSCLPVWTTPLFIFPRTTTGSKWLMD
jgi:hypothetical protein